MSVWGALVWGQGSWGEEPPPPPPPSSSGGSAAPFIPQRVSVDYYLSLVSSQHRDKPKYLAVLEIALQPLVDTQNLALAQQTIFDLDTAVGDQLDKTGEWIGLTRFIAEPLAQNWFSWGVPGAGWSQAEWKHAFAPAGSQLYRLDDMHYRTLLKARVAANVWDGTVPGAYRAWNTIFEPEGFQILIQNVSPKTVPWFTWGDALSGWGQSAWFQFLEFASDNKHIILALVGPELDALTRALFTGGYLDLRPAGTAIDAYATQSVPGRPMFAWGAGPAEAGDYTCPPVNLGGWGIGAWADMKTGV